MNLLFDITHPAHFHLFKNFMLYLKEKGHKVIITSRKKDVLESLLDYYGFDYYSLSTPAKSTLGMLKELYVRNKKIFELHNKYRFDASFGTSVSIGFLKLKYGVPAYNFNEDDDEVVKKYIWLAYPLATKIINPDCLKFKKWKKKRILYPSFHEMAYLHPDNYIPKIETLKKYNLEKGNYYTLRLSALEAHHDTQARGISEGMLDKIIEIGRNYKVVKSIERSKSHQIEPQDMLDIIAFSKAVISDSQTMTIEAAVLGVPAVRINTFIDKSTVITELEKKYKLAFGFYPSDEGKIVETITYLAENGSIDNIWQERRKKMLEDKVDFNQWMINYFNKEINVNGDS